MARPRSRDGKISPATSFGTYRAFDDAGRPMDTPPSVLTADHSRDCTCFAPNQIDSPGLCPACRAGIAELRANTSSPIPSPQKEIIMATTTNTKTDTPAASTVPAVQTAPPSNAIAVPTGLPFAPEAWAALVPAEREAMIALYRAEMEEARNIDIDRKVFQVKFPPTGGREFEIPDPTGATEPSFAVSIEAAVIWSQKIRDYYPEGQKLGLPPLCASPDRLRPYPSPTAQAKSCGTCRWAQWGSGRNGEGQGCKVKYRLFVLRPGETMPRIITLPTMSAKQYETYTTLLKVKGLLPSVVQTTFTITRVESGENKYPLAVMKDGAALSIPDFQRVTSMRDACKKIAEDFGSSLSVEVEDEPVETAPGEYGSTVIDHDTGEVLDGKARREEPGF